MEELIIGMVVGGGAITALRMLWQRIRHTRSQRQQTPSSPPYDKAIDAVGESGLERWVEYRRRNA